jgi:hypothetical protein
MKNIFIGMFLLVSSLGLAKENMLTNDLCNVQVTSTYAATEKCRVNDVMIGAEIQDGTLKLRCGHPIVLCPLARSSNAKSTNGQPNAAQNAERWYCTGICYIIGDPEVDPHHKVSTYGPTEAAARAALKCDPRDLSDVVCRQVETN